MPAILLNQPACLPLAPGILPARQELPVASRSQAKGPAAQWIELGELPSPPHSSLQPDKQKPRRQPLEEMHADIFYSSGRR